MTLDKQELYNLIQIVGSHPTPQGVASQKGQIKIALIGKLSKMLDNFEATTHEKQGK